MPRSGSAAKPRPAVLLSKSAGKHPNQALVYNVVDGLILSTAVAPRIRSHVHSIQRRYIYSVNGYPGFTWKMKARWMIGNFKYFFSPFTRIQCCYSFDPGVAVQFSNYFRFSQTDEHYSFVE